MLEDTQTRERETSFHDDGAVVTESGYYRAVSISNFGGPQGSEGYRLRWADLLRKAADEIERRRHPRVRLSGIDLNGDDRGETVTLYFGDTRPLDTERYRVSPETAERLFREADSGADSGEATEADKGD